MVSANVDLVRRQVASILRAWKMPEDLIDTTTKVMVETDLWGVDSHGISMLMTYEQKLSEKRLQITARPRVVRETAVMALIDAGAGLGHPAAVMGMDLAANKASENGLAVVTVTNSHHFGAAGYYARMAAERGLIGMVASSARGITVVPARGARPVLGTNPLAFAAPAGRNPPFVLDMATSTVAVGKVKVYGYQNKTLPEGWVAGADGVPMRDGTQAYNALVSGNGSAGLTPIGGTPELAYHKGYGLGLLVHILGGVLAGGAFAPFRKGRDKAGEPENIGHFFLAIDPTVFREDGVFEVELDDILDFLRATPPADPALPVLIPGDPELSVRERRLSEGIPIPAALGAQLNDLCHRAGVDYLLG